MEAEVFPWMYTEIDSHVVPRPVEAATYHLIIGNRDSVKPQGFVKGFEPERQGRNEGAVEIEKDCSVFHRQFPKG